MKSNDALGYVLQLQQEFWNNWWISIVFYHRKWNKWIFLKRKFHAESLHFISHSCAYSLFLYHARVRGHVIHLQYCKSFWVMDRNFRLSWAHQQLNRLNSKWNDNEWKMVVEQKEYKSLSIYMFRAFVFEADVLNLLHAVVLDSKIVCVRIFMGWHGMRMDRHNIRKTDSRRKMLKLTKLNLTTFRIQRIQRMNAERLTSEPNRWSIEKESRESNSTKRHGKCSKMTENFQSSACNQAPVVVLAFFAAFHQLHCIRRMTNAW